MYADELEEIIKKLRGTLFDEEMKDADLSSKQRKESESDQIATDADKDLRWYGDNGLVSHLNKYFKAVKRQKVSVINDEITKVAAMPRNWQRELLLAYIYEENNYDDVDILEKYESAYKMCDQ